MRWPAFAEWVVLVGLGVVVLGCFGLVSGVGKDAAGVCCFGLLIAFAGAVAKSMD